MPHSTNKELIFGIMVGTAGVSLLVLWYHKIRKANATVTLPKFLSLGNTFDSVTLQDETHNGTAVIFQRKQLQILEKLNELLTNMDELKEEVKILKETISKLEECMQDELGGTITGHKISPQHRARKRKLTTVQSSASRHSSEEAESEGGYCKEDQSYQPDCPDDQVASDPQHHGASSILPPKMSFHRKTSRPSAFYEVIAPKESRKFSKASNEFVRSFPSARRLSLFDRFLKGSLFPSKRQSRVNFDSQENINFGDSPLEHFAAFQSRGSFSSRKLSIVSCYSSTIFFDPQANGHDMFNLNEIEFFSKGTGHADADRHTSVIPEYNSKYITSFEGRVPLVRWNTADRASYQQSMSSFFSLPTVASSTSQTNGFFIDAKESDQLNKESKVSFHLGSQSHGTNHSPSMTQQYPYSQSETSPGFHNIGFSSFYKNAGSYISFQNEVISGPQEQENISVTPEDEDKPVPIEIPTIRYITANTDTEEQNFPVPQAFNTQVEEFKLDILLQKADHLRMNEVGKVESFELLCDHKEKFKDEVEFMWRFARAYGDMCDISTNTQEKKHYANIGKTLGEKSITRAPMNGHCHMWYAILCGHVSEFEGLQNKINYGHRFKEHLDIALKLLPEEPYLYYLKGRYCYTVSKLSWIEKKMAATLFGNIPTSNVRESLHNFLKAEELQPGFSIPNYMYLAKCYIDLDEGQNASKFCNLALLLPIISNEDKEANKEVKKLMISLKK